MRAAVTVAGFVILGVVVGWLWSVLADPPVFTVTGGQALMGEQEAGRQFGVAADFIWLGAIAAALGGLVVGWFADRLGWTYLVFLIVAATIGSCVAWRLGVLLGPVDPRTVVATGEGDTIAARLAIDSLGALLIWPVAAMLGSILATMMLALVRPETPLGEPSEAHTV